VVVVVVGAAVVVVVVGTAVVVVVVGTAVVVVVVGTAVVVVVVGAAVVVVVVGEHSAQSSAIVQFVPQSYSPNVPVITDIKVPPFKQCFLGSEPTVKFNVCSVPLQFIIEY
jgi:hypothetical protein